MYFLGAIQLNLAKPMQNDFCAKVRLKLRIRPKLGRRSVFLRLSDFQLGPRQRVRHVGVDDVTESTAEAGFIFGHLAWNPHYDNVTRRHGYSWRTSGFCEWRRGGVIFYRFVLEEKGPFGFFGRAPSAQLKKPSQKVKTAFFR